MGTLLAYIIKSALCLTLLYLPYTLLLRRESLHRLNRMALLGMLAVSFLLPSLQGNPLESLGLSWRETGGETVYTALANEMGKVDTVVLPAAEGGAAWAKALVALYIIGVIVSLCVRLLQFFRMWRFIPQGCLWTEQRADGTTVYCHAAPVSPFSWMRAIVLSEEDTTAEGKAVMLHEEAHVRYGHSYDTLLILVAETLQWFNPVIWMLEMDLRCIHEFQADNYVLNHGINEREYQLYLIKKAVGSRLQSFANGLNQSTLKKRIAMMCNKKSTKWAALKYMYLLPTGALALMSFTRPEMANRVDGQLREVSEVKVTDLSATVKAAVQKKTTLDRDTVYEKPQEFPLFPGGDVELMKFIAETCKYPDSCIAKGIQGRVILQFIIRKDGSISDKMTAIRSPHPDLTKEAKRIISLMPKWIPGKQDGKPVNTMFTIPISFRLN